MGRSLELPKIFFIPSWWPYPAEPTSGVFIRDQAFALAALRPDWTVAVSLWGQGELTLSPRTPWLAPHALRRALRARTRVRQVRPNLLEAETPRLTWSNRVGGRGRAVVDACRRNYEATAELVGGFDLIHAHVSFPGGWAALALSREHGLPYVVTEHMGERPFGVLTGRDGALKSLAREPLERAAARIALSPTHAARLHGFGIEAVECLPEVVDETVFSPGPSPVGSERERFVFFSLGRLTFAKGFDDLLAAAARLPPDRFELRIGGVGPDEAALRRQARQYGLNSVSWLGPLDRPSLVAEFRRCDCFVLASRHESFGVVYAEATACGKPIVATRSGGPEAIVTAENGLLVDVGDRDALAAAMASMLEGTDAYDPAAIRQQFLERYSRPAVVDRLEAVYEHVLERVPPAAVA